MPENEPSLPLEPQAPRPAPAIHPAWRDALAEEFASDRMNKLRDFLRDQVRAGQVVYPRMKDVFRAFDLTPPDQVKVLILGQDPYHGEGQAHGLAFSVRPGIPVPPSLVNIYRELETDLGLAPARHGFLEAWAERGVLLLNSILTVRRAEAASHRGKGWEQFTDAVVRVVADSPQPTVFMLWGSHAQKKAKAVDEGRHLVIRSPHPSPLSAHTGFFGTKPFSRANDFLRDHGRGEIDWSLPRSVSDAVSDPAPAPAPAPDA